MRKAVPRAGAKRPGFTLIEGLVCVSLVGTVSAGIFLLFYAGETSFIGASEEGIAVAEAQHAMRALATDVRAASAFVPPAHGGLRVLLDDGRYVEFYQDGRVLKRIERTSEAGDTEDEEERRSWLDRLLGRLFGRGRDERDDHGGRGDSDERGRRGDRDDRDDGDGRGDGHDEDDGGGGVARETTSNIASGLAAVGGFTLTFYDKTMNTIDTPREASEYDRAAVVQATLVVPWAHDGLGRVKRTTLLAPRNDD